MSTRASRSTSLAVQAPSSNVAARTARDRVVGYRIFSAYRHIRSDPCGSVSWLVGSTCTMDPERRRFPVPRLLVAAGFLLIALSAYDGRDDAEPRAEAAIVPTPSASPAAEPTPNVPPRFDALIRRIGPETIARMGTSWRPGCPVGLEDLRSILMTHWGFGGRGGTGRAHRAPQARDRRREGLRGPLRCAVPDRADGTGQRIHGQRPSAGAVQQHRRLQLPRTGRRRTHMVGAFLRHRGRHQPGPEPVRLSQRPHRTAVRRSVGGPDASKSRA